MIRVQAPWILWAPPVYRKNRLTSPAPLEMFANYPLAGQWEWTDDQSSGPECALFLLLLLAEAENFDSNAHAKGWEVLSQQGTGMPNPGWKKVCGQKKIPWAARCQIHLLKIRRNPWGEDSGKNISEIQLFAFFETCTEGRLFSSLWGSAKISK